VARVQLVGLRRRSDEGVLLTLGRMLETAVLDGTHELGLQEEVLEAGGVDADVAPASEPAS